MTEIKIDQEFKSLIPPLTVDEYNQLEQNLIADGIRDPLVTWNGILIDGHNRYDIAQKHNLDFKTVEMQFDSRDDAKIWIYNNQIGRRNLTDYTRGRLTLTMKPIFAAKAKEKQIEGGKNKVPQIFAEPTEDLTEKQVAKQQANERETMSQLAKMAGVSRENLRKIERIEQKAPEEVKQSIRQDIKKAAL